MRTTRFRAAKHSSAVDPSETSHPPPEVRRSKRLSALPLSGSESSPKATDQVNSQNFSTPKIKLVRRQRDLSVTPSSPIFDLPKHITDSPQTLHHDDPIVVDETKSTHWKNFQRVYDQGRNEALVTDNRCCGIIRHIRRGVLRYNVETALYLLSSLESFAFNSAILLMIAGGIKLLAGYTDFGS